MGSVSATVDLQLGTSALIAAGIELAVIAVLLGLLYAPVLLVMRRPSLRTGRWATWSSVARLKARNLLLVVLFAATVTVLGYNGWLLAQGMDATQHTLGLLRAITVETWRAAGLVLAKLALAVLGAAVITRLLRGLTRAAEAGINRWDQLKDNNRSLAALFRGLDRAIANVGWMLVAIFGCTLIAAPQQITDAWCCCCASMSSSRLA